MRLSNAFAGQYRFTREGISLGQKWLLALPGPAMSLSTVLIHNVYIKMYTDVIGLDTMYVGMIYFWFNLWNMLNDPVFGVLIDRTKYRAGKGRFVRLMRISVPFILLSLAAMLFSSPAWEQRTIFLVLLAELFVFDTAFTVFGISNNCYQLIAAPTKEERVDVDVLRGFISNGTSFFATIVPTMLLVGNAQKNRLQIVAILMGVICLNALLYIVSVTRLKEKPEMYALGNADDSHIRMDSIWKDVKSVIGMRAFWTWFFHSLLTYGPMGIYFTAYLYYMDHVIKASGVEATIADTGSMILVLAVLPIIGTQVKRIGGKRSIFLSLIPYLSGLVVLFLSVNWWQVTVAYVFIQLGKYMASTAGGPLGAAIIDENEKLTGSRKTGLFGAVGALLLAPVGGLQMILFMGILKATGYAEGADVQSAGAVMGIRVASAVVPMVFALLGMIPLALFPYDKQKEEELSLFSAQRRAGLSGTESENVDLEQSM